MQHAMIAQVETSARHARLFELIRQQCRAERIARCIATGPAPGDAALAEVARRAAASWCKIC